MTSGESTPRRSVIPGPVALVLLAMLCGKTGAAVAKLGLFSAVGSSGAAVLRVTLAALLLGVLVRPPLLRFTREQWAVVLPYGVVIVAMNLCFYLALARIPLGLAMTLQFLGPLGLAVLGAKRAADVLWALLALVGIVLLAPWSGGDAALDPWGVALALLAGGCWAGYIVLGRRVSQRLPRAWGVAAGMAVAATVMLPLTLMRLTPANLTPSVLGLGLVVAVLSSAVPYTLELAALRALPDRVFGVLMSLEPAVSALVGLLLLGEQLAPTRWAAVACVSAAAAGATFLASRERQARAEDAETPSPLPMGRGSG